MPTADRAFSALLDDLSERGLLDETLVVCPSRHRFVTTTISRNAAANCMIRRASTPP